MDRRGGHAWRVTLGMQIHFVFPARENSGLVPCWAAFLFHLTGLMHYRLSQKAVGLEDAVLFCFDIRYAAIHLDGVHDGLYP